MFDSNLQTSAPSPTSPLRPTDARVSVPAVLAAALVLALCAAPGTAADTATVAPAVLVDSGAMERIAGVAGKVSGTAAPLAAAKVYVYHLGELEMQEAVTDQRGHFLFGDLPAGLYRVIAHKPGFVPAVVRLARSTADAYQFLELELSAAAPTTHGGAEADDFWALRKQVPPDVLRDIQVAEIQAQARDAGNQQRVRAAALLAEMEAMTGIDRLGSGEGQITTGAVGIRGRVGGVQLGLEGDYWQMQPGLSEGDSAVPSGETRALALSVADEGDVSVRLSSRSDRLAQGAGVGDDVDFENYRLAVTHSVGKRGRSDFIAQYTSESNLHRHGWVDPLGIPEASRSWRLEGTYTAELTERASLQTGVRYRQQESAFGVQAQGEDPFATAGLAGDDLLAPEHERVDLFGRAGMQVQPSLLVEYGLYTTLRDGSLSLSPRGGLVMQLGTDWQAAAAAAYKVHDEGEPAFRDFTPALRSADELNDACEINEAHCYQLTLSHRKSDDEVFTVGATHREFDEIQRLYFSDDLIDRNDSLYLVPGDEVPELRLLVSRRLTPTVLAKLESNLAQGGGGVFYATDAEAYENQVRYLVTSLDTRFSGTETGLFIAFHHLRQQLLALEPVSGRPPELEVQRLELMLTQDLNVLLNLATDMAVRLNMELSRGTSPFTADDSERDELRKRLLGGIAVRF